MNFKKIKIVIDARMINHSGIGTYIQSMIPHLVDDYDVALIGEHKKFNTFSWSSKISIIGNASPIYSIQEQLALPLVIPTCNIFISPHYNIPLLPIKARKRIAIIHDVNHLVFRKQFSVVQNIYADIMLNAVPKYSDTVLTVSEFSKNEIVKYIKPKSRNIHVVYPSISVSNTSPLFNPSDFAKVKAKYNLPENYLLFVGSIRTHKNFINTMHAFELLLKEMVNQKLVVVGISDAELKKNSDAVALIAGNEKLKQSIIFTGYVELSHMPILYKKASALIFPSLYEGFGLPAIEAMEAGCPVLVSNSASLPEVCNDAALFVDPQNINKICDGMKIIMTDLDFRNRLIQLGYKNVKKYAPEIFSNKIHKVIHSLVVN